MLRAGAGEFATHMGLLDNIFPGGNPPFQPFVTVAAIAGNFNSMVDNPGLALDPSVAPPLTITTLNQKLTAPTRWNWNLTIQRELPLNSTLSIAYVGARGLNSWRVFDINQPVVGALQANPGKSVNYLRPYLGFAAIQQEQSNGSAKYNALQLAWNRRFTNGFMFGVSYTWAKSMDNGSSYIDIMPDTYDTSNLWGPSGYDARHAVVINLLETVGVVLLWLLAGFLYLSSQTGEPVIGPYVGYSFFFVGTPTIWFWWPFAALFLIATGISYLVLRLRSS